MGTGYGKHHKWPDQVDADRLKVARKYIGQRVAVRTGEAIVGTVTAVVEGDGTSKYPPRMIVSTGPHNVVHLKLREIRGVDPAAEIPPCETP